MDAATDFTGYDALESASEIALLMKDGSAVDTLAEGDEGSVVLSATPFYAESGGQVGDTGTLRTDSASFEVVDTQKSGDAHVHIGRVTTGEMAVGDTVDACVDHDARRATVLNHSATHLLHAALRTILGTHVAQKGSLVAPDRLRFDFSHFDALTPEELESIENWVNDEIRANGSARTEVMTYDDAIEAGAMALFGEKYGDEVRVMKIGGHSTELCGGTHVSRTGDIGLFRITGEGGIAAGVRRIEAVTGQGALDWVREGEATLGTVSSIVKGGRADVVAKVEALSERMKSLEKEIQALKTRLAGGQGNSPDRDAVDVAGLNVLAYRLPDDLDAKSLRDAVDREKSRLVTGVVVLATATPSGKVLIAAGVTKDAVDRIRAGDLVNAVATQVGGRGGGRPDFAQAGGNDPEKLDEAISSVPSIVEAAII